MNPSPEKIRAAMDLLELHVPEKHELNMEAGDCYCRPECGTVACFGGFYALAKLKETGEERWMCTAITSTPFLVTPMRARGSPYSFGYDEFVKDIGIDELAEWARANPDLWGNEHGLKMFLGEEAYGGEPTTITLYDVIDHWRGVANRIEEAAE